MPLPLFYAYTVHCVQSYMYISHRSRCACVVGHYRDRMMFMIVMFNEAIVKTIVALSVPSAVSREPLDLSLFCSGKEVELSGIVLTKTEVRPCSCLN